MSYKKLLSLALISIIILSGCGKEKNNATGETINRVAKAKSVVKLEDMFTDNDYNENYKEDKSIKIKLNKTKVECDSNLVNINKSVVTIKGAGTYIVTGSLENGMLIIDADKKDKIHIVLNNVNVNSKESAPIYIKQAEKVFITVEKNTVNTLSNGGKYISIDENKIDAVIFSKDDLTINGEGKLNIKTTAGHGIVSKDDLVVTNGNINIDVEKHGYQAKGSIRIGGGVSTIKSGKDGINSDNTENNKEGYVYISKGSLKITSKGDGVSAGNFIQIDGGNINVVTGDGSGAATSQSKERQPMDFWNNTKDETQDNSISCKGIKSGENLIINDGKIKLDTYDDGIHSNKSLTINNGSFKMSCGDDGIHANSNVNISGGTIDILKSYEGIEGQSIDIEDGKIKLVSSDDGFNAAGGVDSSGKEVMGKNHADMFAVDENAYIAIDGGEIYMDASGDGIDSNGHFVVNGGEVYVEGPVNGANGALDYQGMAKITGGTVVAVGTTGMALNFGEDSTQGSMLVNIQGKEGSQIELLDSKNKSLFVWKATKSFQSVVLSTSDIKKGKSYVLKVGEETQTIKMNDIIYGSGFGQGFGKDKPGGQGKMPNGERPEMPSGMPQMPDGERPEMPSGMPQMPDEERPEMPGNMPQMQNGEKPDLSGKNGEI